MVLSHCQLSRCNPQSSPDHSSVGGSIASPGELCLKKLTWTPNRCFFPTNGGRRKSSGTKTRCTLTKNQQNRKSTRFPKNKGVPSRLTASDGQTACFDNWARKNDMRPDVPHKPVQNHDRRERKDVREMVKLKWEICSTFWRVIEGVTFLGPSSTFLNAKKTQVKTPWYHRLLLPSLGAKQPTEDQGASCQSKQVSSKQRTRIGLNMEADGTPPTRGA